MESEERNSEGRIVEGEADWGKEMKSHNESMWRKKKREMKVDFVL